MNGVESSLGLLRRTGHNLSFKSLTLLILQGLSFVFYMVLARKLGQEDFGRYALAYSVGAILVIGMDPGLNQWVIREVARDRSRMSSAAPAVLAMKIGLSLILLLGTWMLVPRVPTWYPVSGLIWLMTLVLVLWGFLEFFSALFNALERMHVETCIQGIAKFGVVLGSLAALHLGADLYGLLGVMAGLHLLGVLGAGWATRRQGISLFPGSPHFRDWGEIVSEAFPMALTTVFVVILYRIDVVMLSLFSVGAGDIGYYSAAVKIIDVLLAVPVIFTAAVFPAFSRTLRQNPELLRRYLRQGISVLVLLSVVIGVPIFFEADRSIRLIFGGSFGGAVPALQVLVFALPFIYLRHFLLNVLVVLDLQNQNAWAAGGAVLGNVGLNLVLIPKWGILGSASATVLTDLALFLLVFVLVRRELGRRGL